MLVGENFQKYGISDDLHGMRLPGEGTLMLTVWRRATVTVFLF
jgi:hypothetical protein